MAYLVLARKYRPLTFADVIGQEHIVRTLQNAIQLDRVHHAFLFTGARGVGKTTMARVLARALNCEAGPTANPCGTCATCQDMLAGRNSDVLEIDGASNTGVDNVRELRETARYLPRGRYKLYIIDEVHMLSQAAFNALLKTLEEPPPHVKFIFATTEPHKIPVTILSRCQRFDFRKVSAGDLTAHLRSILSQEQATLSAGALGAVVREAQGSVRDALSLLDQVLSYAGLAEGDGSVLDALGVIDRASIFALAGAIVDRDAAALLQIVQDLDSRGHDLSDVAALLVEHLRDVAVSHALDDAASALPDRGPDEIISLKAQAQSRSQSDWQRLFGRAVAVADDVSRSSFARISLDMGLLSLLEIAPSTDLVTLVQRLDALAQGGPVATPASAAARPSPQTSAPAPPPPQAATHTAKPPPAMAPMAPAAQLTAAGVAPPVAAALPVAAVPPVAPAPSVGASPVAAAPPDDGNLAWRAFVDRVKQVRPALASMLEHARLLSFTLDMVQIAYADGTFYLDAVRDAANFALLGKVLEEQMGQPVRLSVVVLDAAATAHETLAQTQEREKQTVTATRRTEALEHAAVQGAVDILGGVVQEVRLLNDA